MHMHLTPLSLVIFFFFISQTPSFAAPPQDLVRSSCVHARYPNLCLQSLSPYKGDATTPRHLAEAAVKISLAHASRLSDYLKSLQVGSLAKRQQVALRDCVEQISGSVEDLRNTLKELQHMRVETFQWQMSNSQTWVSAALTNDDACVDGFNGVDGNLKWEVKRRITPVARVTSNALFMINRLGNQNPRLPSNQAHVPILSSPTHI